MGQLHLARDGWIDLRIEQAAASTAPHRPSTRVFTRPSPARLGPQTVVTPMF
jgi:hypothetical protein